MGQHTCCSASSKAPQIVHNQQTFLQQTIIQPLSTQKRLKDKAEQQNKSIFYGKNGSINSKTVTKQMSHKIDSQLQAYKNKIFNEEVIQEMNQQAQDQIKTIAEKGSCNQKLIVDKYLDNMAVEISSQV